MREQRKKDKEERLKREMDIIDQKRKKFEQDKQARVSSFLLFESRMQQRSNANFMQPIEEKKEDTKEVKEIKKVDLNKDLKDKISERPKSQTSNSSRKPNARLLEMFNK